MIRREVIEEEALALWNEVEATPGTYTKQSSVDGHKQTAINAHYMVKRATELFGPIGYGWGWDDVDEGFDEGEPQVIKDANGEPQVVRPRWHWYRVRVWYRVGTPDGDQIARLPTSRGITRERYVTSKGQVYIDTEARKKSETDAVKRGLSRLGIAADVYLGLFDDQDYAAIQQAVGADERAEAKAERDGSIQEKREADLATLNDRYADHIGCMAEAKSVRELDMLHARLFRKVLAPAQQIPHLNERATRLIANAQKRRDTYAQKLEAPPEELAGAKGDTEGET